MIAPPTPVLRSWRITRTRGSPLVSASCAVSSALLSSTMTMWSTMAGSPLITSRMWAASLCAGTTAAITRSSYTVPPPGRRRRSRPQRAVGLPHRLDVRTARVALVPCRQDRVRAPPAGPELRIVPRHPQLVGGVVVPVDQVGDGHVGQAGEPVGHTGRDVDALVAVVAAVDLAQVDHLRRPVGGAALAQVVQNHPRVAERHVPVVGLVQVVVQTDDAARDPVAAVALNHLPSAREPLS